MLEYGYELGFNQILITNGVLLEQDSDRMIVQNPSFILPEIESSDITKDVATDGNIVLYNSGRINFKSEEELETLGVEVTNIAISSETSFYRRNLNISSTSATSNDEVGKWVVASSMKKELEYGNTSTLIAFANNIFITDYQVQIGNQYSYAIAIYNNKDIVLNAIAYLNEREDSITIRKDMGVVTYTATEAQDRIIRAIIFIFPVIIILIGIIVWQKRRRKK